MKLAAIDIGSNAIRLQIIRVSKDKDVVHFKKLEFIRFPLRLGVDVFKDGVIKDKTVKKFEKLMIAYKHLVDLYEVDAYRAVATSAMREAKNGQNIIKKLKKKCDFEVEIISGAEEARLISKALSPYLTGAPLVHIDVGGGSTELNYYKDKERKDGKSFKIGSVRKLTAKKRGKVLKKIDDWIESLHLPEGEIVDAIGTGGNIKKLVKLGRTADRKTVSLVELKAIQAYLKEFSLEDRIKNLKMNPDRADVIIPASEIYFRAMKKVGTHEVLVPGVGLKDGLLYSLYEKVSGENILDLEFGGEF